MTNKCNGCVHHGVCKFQKEYRERLEVIESLKDILRGYSDFELILDCKHFKEPYSYYPYTVSGISFNGNASNYPNYGTINNSITDTLTISSTSSTATLSSGK